MKANCVHLQVIHLDLLDIAASIGMGTILGITVAIPSYYYAMTSGHGLGLWSIMKAGGLPVCIMSSGVKPPLTMPLSMAGTCMHNSAHRGVEC